MKAAVCTHYGPPEAVAIATVPKPTPSKHELLIRIHRTTVAYADHRLRSGDFPRGMKTLAKLVIGLTGPRMKILGTEFSGEVVAVGAGVTRFQNGDRVSGVSIGQCHAEYVVLKETGNVAKLPAEVDYDTGTCLAFGGGTALIFLRDKAKMKPGDKVLVIGAAGSVGSAMVQLAKHLQAGEVTGVCSTTNVDLVTSMGADKVIDYKADDFTKNGQRYDIIIDCVGGTNFAKVENSLAEGGKLLLIAADLWETVTSGKRGSKRIYSGGVFTNGKDLQILAGLAAQGAFKPVIDEKRFAFTDIIEAHRYVDGGHKRGNVVVMVAD